MPRPWAALLLLLTILSFPCIAQDRPDKVQEAIDLPSRFLIRLQGRTTSLNDQLTRQTEKYLQKIARREKRELKMNTNYEFTQEGNLISIKIGNKGIKEIENIEMLNFDILSLCYLNQHIQLITIQPQEYSLGFELPLPYKSKIDETEVLLNDLSICTSAMIKTISKSEEFNRGLLILTSNVDSIEMLIRSVLNFQNNICNVITNAKGIIAFCNYDGDYLYLFNSNLSIDDLKALKENHKEG